MEANILFRSPAATGMTGVVDAQNAVLHGVALIHSELEADGHGLWIDKTLLTQLSELGRQNGQVQCNIDHGSGSSNTIGFIDGFRIDGKVLRGDLHLLKSHPETETLLEKAERMPKCVGLSAAFKGDPKGVTVGGKQCARAEKLLSFDLVTRPAAAPNGLFSAKDNANVDKQKNHVSRQTIELQNTMPAEPTLQEVLAELQAVRGELAQQQEISQQLVAHINEGIAGDQNQGEEQGIDRDQLEAYNNASDEQLAELGITRADVDAAVADFNASLGGEQGEQGQEGDGQHEGSYGGEQGAGEMAGAAAGGAEGGAGGATSFAALQRELIQLKARLNKRDAQEIQFAEKQATNEVRSKISAIVSQRDELVQFADRVVAENEALRLHVRTGTRPVAAGVDAGIRLFHSGNEELHPFQQRVLALKAEKKCSDGQAITFAIKEPNGSALHADWLQSNSGHTIRA